MAAWFHFSDPVFMLDIAPTLKPTTLDDKYTLDRGRVFLTGIQALVRLPMLQRQLDLRAGLNTAGFVSGYRGSPLGGVDQALWKADQHLKKHHIHFEPGINEDLAATAVWGTQQIDIIGGSRYDGVFGLWYGKGPGVDRSSDVLKHANLAGTAKNGGVLLVGGDDHGCKSSTLPHQSELAYADFMIPVLNPAGIQEILDYGLYGWAMSRFTGLWVALKIVSDTADSAASVEIGLDRTPIVLPKDFKIPPKGLNQQGSNWPPVGLEDLLHNHKIPAAQAFVRANKLDKIIWDSPKARLGIASTGKAYLDLRQALFDLGIDESKAAQIGLRLYKVAMPWPLEPQGVVNFAGGLEEILFVEEKRDVMESQAKAILYNRPDLRPRILGKVDEDGASLLASIDELSPLEVAVAVGKRILKITDDAAIADRVRKFEQILNNQDPHVVGFNRIPYFCSGCPHNTSTHVPAGSTALAGIGCHIMALWMDRDTTTVTQMGGEGVSWVGQAPFTDTKHVFVNMGDGTYYHSGLLAVRAAVSANVNATYKILYNDAVAMTGGQPVEGGLTVGQITRQLAAEGVGKIFVVTDEPDKYPRGYDFAPGVTVHHRSELDALQRQLRDISGVTGLIYDQTCAAEKRRRRKRGTFPDPDRRIFINDKVCEGCGDCSKASNCLSVTPIETEYGRKRKIDQSSCNKDFSCVNGFCPSFVSVSGGRPRRSQSGGSAIMQEKLQDPVIQNHAKPVSLLINGIGGTGVVTIGALLGMAAHLEGKGCTVMDMTGLAQKGGSVWSHVRIAPKPEDLYAVRIASSNADYVLGADLVVTGSAETLDKMASGHTKAIVNADEIITGNFPRNTDLEFPSLALKASIESRIGKESVRFIDATRVATALMGDSIATNLFMLGYAWQMGWIPLSEASILRAIELNEVSVATNQQSFRWGRKAALDWNGVKDIAAPKWTPDHHNIAQSLDDIVAKRADFLEKYQNKAYAQSYLDFVAKVKAKGFEDVTKAVAKNLFKLMAYKDEYEVARLYTDGDFIKQLRDQFEGDIKLKFHLAPPLLAPKHPESGHLQKMTFGPWMLSAFGVLAKFKSLRGTPFDIFGYTAERKMERRLIEEYRNDIESMLPKLSAKNAVLAVKIAAIPEKMRGFGHIKEANVCAAEAEKQKLLEKFNG